MKHHAGHWHETACDLVRTGTGPLPVCIVPSKGGPCLTGRTSWEDLALVSSLKPDEPVQPKPEVMQARLARALERAVLDMDPDQAEREVREWLANRDRRAGGPVFHGRSA